MKSKLLSALLNTLAVGGVAAVEPAALAFGQMPLSQHTVKQVAADHTIQVTGTLALNDAYSQAEAWLKLDSNAGKRVLIKIPAGEHVFSAHDSARIKANGTVIFEGVKPVDFDTTGHTIINVKNKHGYWFVDGNITNESPVEFRNIEFRATEPFFVIRSDFLMDHCATKYVGHNTGAKELFDLENGEPEAFLVQVTNSSIRSLGLHRNQIWNDRMLNSPRFIIKNNTFDLDQCVAMVGQPVFDIPAYQKQFTHEPDIIEDNVFISPNKQLKVPEGKGTLFRILRPNVVFQRNRVELGYVPAGLRVFDVHGEVDQLDPNRFAPVTKVHIVYNLLQGGMTLTNTVAGPELNVPNLPPEKKAVQFRFNRVEESWGALPAGELALNADTGFNLRNNYWRFKEPVVVGGLMPGDPVITDQNLAGPGAFDPNWNSPMPTPVPTSTPVPTPTPVPTSTPIPTPTPVPTSTPIPTPTPVPTSTPTPVPTTTPVPVPTPTGPGQVVVGPGGVDGPMLWRFAGASRVETAVDIARAEFGPGVPAVIVARADVAADSVAAVPLATTLGAPILVTQPDSLHEAAGAELKRLLPEGGRVIFMGGEVALSRTVVEAVEALGGKVERIAGENRAGTAVATAEVLKTLGKAEQVLLVDGSDWQPSLIAGPAAAKTKGVTLLTNGRVMAPETEAFLDAHKALPLTAIGSVAKEAGKVSQAIEAGSPEALSVAVAAQLFGAPRAVGLATTVEFADALAGGAHVARYGGPMLLTGGVVDAAIVDGVGGQSGLEQVMVYGGPVRIPDASLRVLSDQPVTEK